MKTPNFEVQFITRLRDHIVSKYPGLSLSVSRTSHQPNIVISNAHTGDMLGIHVAGGAGSTPVPAATISVLVEMNDAIKAQQAHQRPMEIWLVSSGRVLPPWTNILEQEHIRVISAPSVEEALNKLDRRLHALAAGD